MLYYTQQRGYIITTKLRLDKYYTSPQLAKYVVDKTKEIIGENNITEYIEPSAGAGVFLQYLDKPYQAYDIEPDGNKIVQQDYLSLGLLYQQGRCIIGNPPFGENNNLTVRFFKKAIHEGDYISFILPISQLNNDIKLYEFDLIYSEDLGIREYSDRDVHCCLNIYKRPKGGNFNKRPNHKLKDVIIHEVTRTNNPKRNKVYNGNYDIRIVAWGARVGEEIMGSEKYANEFFIEVKNQEYKEEVVKVMRQTKWEEVYPMTAMKNLLHWQVYKHLREMIPELE